MAEGEYPKVDGDVLYASDLNSLAPIGTIFAWLKTFDSADSGTTDGTTADKLVQSGQNFDSTVAVGYVVHNTTDNTFAYVTAVDSATTLSIDSDIMVSGEAFTIYKTPQLPTNNAWVECDGSTLSDSESVFNGATLPNLNGGAVEDNYSYFLRGHLSSGQVETSQNKAHTHEIKRGSNSGTTAFYNREVASGTDPTNSEGGVEARPMAYTVVWIMRVK